MLMEAFMKENDFEIKQMEMDDIIIQKGDLMSDNEMMINTMEKGKKF